MCVLFLSLARPKEYDRSIVSLDIEGGLLLHPSDELSWCFVHLETILVELEGLLGDGEFVWVLWKLF
tara:strand:- start:220 stop:420 length:201 start_codon:yes stop_codon:yes gene_type:complete